MQTADFVHKPVLFDEVLESLRIKPDGIYVDGTPEVPDIPQV